MHAQRPARVFILFFFAVFLCIPPSEAQSPVDPAQLPARTSFYLLWRGSPSGDVRAKNSLYAVWDDADFVPARAALLDALLSEHRNLKPKPESATKANINYTPQRLNETSFSNTLSRQEAAQFLTLLDNPFLVGFLRRPESSNAAKPASAKDKPAWNGVFVIYDRTGKEELLSRAVLHFRGSGTEIPKLTNLTVAGIPALKVERKDNLTYWAEFSKFAVSAQELAVFEEILTLLNGKPAPHALSQVPVFVEAKPILSGGLAEFFVNISNLKEIALDVSGSSPVAVQFKPFLNSLKLDSFHSVSGHLSLESSRTHVVGAILGDTTPGGLFDIFADGKAKPASMSYLFPDTLYYSESQVDLLGFYKILRRAFTQAIGGSAEQKNLLDTMAETRLGMPLEDALGLTTGEIASLQTSPAFDKNQQVYFLGIRNKPDTLKLLRTLMGERITSERNEGNSTFLKISLQGGQGTAGVAQWNFYHVAVTANALLGSPKSETLHTYLNAIASGDPAPPKQWQTVRAQFPEKLSGLIFVDFQKLDWSALKANWIAEANKAAAQNSKDTGPRGNPSAPVWLNAIKPEVFSRHLHTMAGASWKEGNGVHFDEWLD